MTKSLDQLWILLWGTSASALTGPHLPPASRAQLSLGDAYAAGAGVSAGAGVGASPGSDACSDSGVLPPLMVAVLGTQRLVRGSKCFCIRAGIQVEMGCVGQA